MKYITVITACLILFGCSFNRETSSEPSVKNPKLITSINLAGDLGSDITLWDLYYMSAVASGNYTVIDQPSLRYNAAEIADMMLKERAKRFN